MGIREAAQFSSKVLARDIDSPGRNAYNKYLAEKIKAAFEQRKLSDEAQALAPLNLLKENV